MCIRDRVVVAAVVMMILDAIALHSPGLHCTCLRHCPTPKRATSSSTSSTRLFRVLPLPCLPPGFPLNIFFTAMLSIIHCTWPAHRFCSFQSHNNIYFPENSPALHLFLCYICLYLFWHHKSFTILSFPSLKPTLFPNYQRPSLLPYILQWVLKCFHRS